MTEKSNDADFSDDETEDVEYLKDTNFSDDEIWDLRRTLAYHIVPRLSNFRDKWKNNEAVAIANWVSDDKSLSQEEYATIWIGYLDEMIVAFESLINYPKYSHHGVDGIEKLQERGFLLFGKYYGDLWD